MNKYSYKEVNTIEKYKEDEETDNGGLPRKMLFRQIFVSSGVWASYFIFGLSIGAPTVFIPQMRREANSTDAVSTEMASWLNAIYGFGELPWILIISILLRYFGRVLPYRLISLTTVIGTICFYFSSTFVSILISEAILSISGAGSWTIFIIILGEYTSPQYRGVFLTAKSATFLWGIWVSNAIGTYFYWKNIIFILFFTSMYFTAAALLLPESPYWLASQGRIEESIASQRWLKGYTVAANEELKSIIDSQDEIAGFKNESNSVIRNIYDAFTSKEIYKPLLCSMLMTNLYYSTGKFVCTMYAIDIIKKISSSESVAYTVMLTLDGITVLSTYIGCGLSKKLKRKTLLTSTTCLGIIFLLVMSVYLYLVKLSVLEENKYLSAGLLICFSICISSGPMILSSSICGEILPLKFRSTIACIIASYDRIIMGISLKIAPAVFICFDTHGAFFFFAALTSFFLTIVYLYLPETKDMTLKEISFLMDTKKVERSILSDRDINITDLHGK